MRSAGLWVILLGGCSPTPAPGFLSEAIINGTPDTGDPAVVLLFSYVPQMPGGKICTAEVVAPNVLLTAAHCLHPALARSGAKFRAYLVPNINTTIDAADQVPIKEVYYHPRFDPSQSTATTNLYDIGVAITTRPLDIPPLPMNRSPLGSMAIGETVRMVGYGKTDAANSSSFGQKTQAPNRITALDFDLMTLLDGVHFACSGDSGGPALIMQAGVETIVGVFSQIGGGTCAGKSYFTRVDLYAASFIDPIIAANPLPPPDMATADLEETAPSDSSVAPDGEAPPVTASGCGIARRQGGGYEVLTVMLFLLARRRRPGSPRRTLD